MDVPESIPAGSDAANLPAENGSLPVFLKPEHLKILVIGGQQPALDLIRTILDSAPEAPVKVVHRDIDPAIMEWQRTHPTLEVVRKDFRLADAEGTQLIFIALEDLSEAISYRNVLKRGSPLVNVVGFPEHSDFDLGPVVRRGDIKIAISGNGHAKAIAGRIGEMIQYMLPDGIDRVLQKARPSKSVGNQNLYGRLRQLNNLSRVLMAKQLKLDDQARAHEKRWQKVVKWCLFAFFFMLLGHGLLSWLPTMGFAAVVREIPHFVNSRSFLIMLLTGFLAQMVDGSLGMGYGTISTTFLLAMGVSPAIVSSRVHSARVFSSGVSGYSHHRFGNINKKLFGTLVVPGVLGAVAGAVMAYFGQKYSSYLRIPLSIYTVYLGYYIVRKAFKRNKNAEKVKSAGWLASAGGFMDAFAGGGWGTLVTSTLIAKRRSPRYVVGSVCLAEFFVVLASSITFFILLQSIPIGDVIGLVVGGLIAAPVAARLVGKLPLKTTFIIVGLFVILTSLNTLWKAVLSI